jgi:predicted DNA repair protein MutK
MASGLLILLDDIASLLDDVAILTKVAAKKTAGVLGDDLALNAQQVTGVSPNRELPVVWAVAKGSLVNKAILVPAAVVLSLFMPWAILPLMIAGGTFLCFEGCEKLMHKFLHSHAEDEAAHEELKSAIANPTVDIVAHEKEKVKGAIRTDFILSAEIIVITLGTVSAASIGTQIGVLVTVAIVMTIGVYGLVAGIVKLDDLGAHLIVTAGNGFSSSLRTQLGRSILWLAPWLMKFLSVAGTIAMFLVGGGILTHGIPPLHHAIEHVVHMIPDSSIASSVLRVIVATSLDAIVGVAAGALVVLTVMIWKRLFKRPIEPATAGGH